MKKHDFTVENHVILFMDVHDCSIVLDILEKSKRSLSRFLQEVYEILGDIILEYRGEIIKYAGDSILCVFPGGSESEVVRCSLELRSAFSNIVRDKNIPHDTELEIGISSGEVEIGIVGHRSLMQKDVFGEQVSLAAMIGHHKGIAITENVYNRVKMNYETRELDELSVKWRNEPLRVWEVME